MNPLAEPMGIIIGVFALVILWSATALVLMLFCIKRIRERSHWIAAGSGLCLASLPFMDLHEGIPLCLGVLLGMIFTVSVIFTLSHVSLTRDRGLSIAGICFLLLTLIGVMLVWAIFGSLGEYIQMKR